MLAIHTNGVASGSTSLSISSPLFSFKKLCGVTSSRALIPQVHRLNRLRTPLGSAPNEDSYHNLKFPSLTHLYDARQLTLWSYVWYMYSQIESIASVLLTRITSLDKHSFWHFWWTPLEPMMMGSNNIFGILSHRKLPGLTNLRSYWSLL